MKTVLMIAALGVELLAPLMGLASARADTPVAQREPPAGAIGGTRFAPPDEIEIVTPTPTPIWLRGKGSTTLAARLVDQSVRIVSPTPGQEFSRTDMVTLHVVRASQRDAGRDRLLPRFDLELPQSDDGRSWTPHGMWVLEGGLSPTGMQMPASTFRVAPRWRLRARLAMDVTGAPAVPWTEWTEFRVSA